MIPKLTPHGEALLEQFKEMRPSLEQLSDKVYAQLQQVLQEQTVEISSIERRVKTVESLAGKLERKGDKYASLEDITDLLGLRIVTFYTDDVDKVAAIVQQLYDVVWEKSVDKRKLHELNSFGYNSLHYICRLPKSIVDDPDCPALNEIRFELQLRTTLQHAWASINHDIGYKTGVEIPRDYLRRINRLAGILEMADDEFSRIRTEITDYRRRVQQLVQNGKLDDLQLDGDTFTSYLQARPFDALNKRIASINQAEIEEVPLIRYLRVFKEYGCKTLGDVHRMKLKYENDAYRLARYQLGNTDLDIISSAVGVQNICIICILATGGGKMGLIRLFDLINGDNNQNEALADITYEQASKLQVEN